ncbi:histidine kinase dimerization/phosphoacceptor domain -containing protein [Novosphingobium sp. Leaf2]|uniref:histidine kinase dimerization/phosphoacceptor domain -containing protein n=1 Tax=Novosphingobium sp. Leaf2 TaxID=1735670 RepID=UPI0006F74614|nr:histidine kinase dimerization/phosphoacceptor domain -containing protein [Novosphingobium sp. Leaf2]KQM13335.1 phytochrome [Novosphingobium sp. Leaf2]
MDLTQCDREPIHVPGAIQPHGALLVASADDLVIVGGAGDLEARFGAPWQGQLVAALLGFETAQKLASCSTDKCPLGWLPNLGSNAVAFRADGHWLIQIEPSEGPELAVDILGWIDDVGGHFERAAGLKDLCQRAAESFSELTGYDRVMIYRFLDDEAGTVVAEATKPGMSSFMNHHFPASDIPKQARALYVRNRVRVIPDVHYTPQPIRPEALAGIDLSDVELRSVSPIHVQYLKNMGVGASASVSIVRDGLLWGLVACHNQTPRNLGMAQRRAAQLVAGGMARQIGAKEEAEVYRQRIRVRTEEDALQGKLAGSEPLFDLLAAASDSLMRMFDADGFAIVHGAQVHMHGECPDRDGVREIADWARTRGAAPFHTHELSRHFAAASAYRAHASGLISLTLSTRIPTVLLWLRAEAPQVVEWAGNPHKAVALKDGEILTPRASFDAWTEVVRSRARPWSIAETEGAHRLLAKLYDVRQNQRVRDLADSLTVAVADKERLLEQKDVLLKEVNHRVQNSIQLIITFLSMQARSSDDPTVQRHLAEAQSRLSAVSLVYRRLYSDDNVETVDLSRYLEELVKDLDTAMGPEWAGCVATDFAPVIIPADDAVRVGLILVELVINAQKYAYGGAPGPISIILEQHRNRFRLIVSDRGGGRSGTRRGFGSRMLDAMVKSLSGTMEDSDNLPGLRVILSAPIGTPGTHAYQPVFASESNSDRAD